MKTSRLITTIALTLFTFLSFNTTAQNFKDLDKSPMDVAAFPADYKDSNKLIKVTYSRPQLKERSLEKLAPKGKVWRTGANEAPEITLYTDLMLGGKKIAAGTYSLFTIPGDNEWTIIINKDLNIWGAYFYKEENDVARLTVPAKSVNDSLEAFSIAFEKAENGTHMHLGWGTTRVTVPFTK